MANIAGGKIYYTVDVDPRTLKAAINMLQQLANVVGKVNKNAASGASKEVRQYSQSVSILQASIGKANAELANGAKNQREYDARMATLAKRAEKLKVIFDTKVKAYVKSADSALVAEKANRSLEESINKIGRSKPGGLAEYANQAKQLSKDLQGLKSDFEGGRINANQYDQEMQDLANRATQVRTAFEAQRNTLVKTSSDQATAADATRTLAQVMTEATKEATGFSYSFADLTGNLRGLNAGIRASTQEFSTGTLKSKEYMQSLNGYKVALGAASAEIDRLRKTVGLTADQLRKLDVAQGQVTRGLTAIEKGSFKATGAMTKKMLTAQLSMGALTTLNNVIFRMSPALGILTNQLMFATQGFMAFVRAAGPIILIAGSIIALIAAVRSAVRAGTQLETAWVSVAKTTNLTNGQLQTMTATFQGMAKEIPISTLELLDFARIAGQLGITGVDNITRFSEAIAKLSIATKVVGEEGATSLARFLQATGVSVNRIGAYAIQVGNILNELENTTASTADEILKMTSYTQGLASQAGASQAEILGLNSALLSLGVKAEAGGSAVVRTVGKMQVAIADSGLALDKFAMAAGVTTEEFRKVAESSPIEALSLLATGLNTAAASGASLNNVLTELGIREVRERRTLLALAQGAETFQKAIKTANDEAMNMVSLNTEIAKVADTVASKFQMLKNRFATLAQQFGVILQPAMRGFLDLLIFLSDGLIDLINGITWAANALRDLLGVVRSISAEVEDTWSVFDSAATETDMLTEAMMDLGTTTELTGQRIASILNTVRVAFTDFGKGEVFKDFFLANIKPLLEQGLRAEAVAVAMMELARLRVEALEAEATALESVLSVSTPNILTQRTLLGENRQRLEFISNFRDTLDVLIDSASDANSKILENLFFTNGNKDQAKVNDFVNRITTTLRNAGFDLGLDFSVFQRSVQDAFDTGSVDDFAKALLFLRTNSVMSLDKQIESLNTSINDILTEPNFAEWNKTQEQATSLQNQVNQQLDLTRQLLGRISETSTLDEIVQALNETIGTRVMLGFDFDYAELSDQFAQIQDAVEQEIQMIKIRLDPTIGTPGYTIADSLADEARQLERAIDGIQNVIRGYRALGGMDRMPDIVTETLLEYIARLRELQGTLVSSTDKSIQQVVNEVKKNLDIQLGIININFGLGIIDYLDSQRARFEAFKAAVASTVEAISTATVSGELIPDSVNDQLNAFMSHWVGLENIINFEVINEAFKEIENSIKEIDIMASTYNKTQGQIFEEKAGIYLDAIDKFRQLGFGPESDVLRYFALEAKSMQDAANIFNESVEYLEQADSIYSNLANQLVRISRLSADGRMSELERLNQIKDVQQAAVDAAIALGRTDDVRFVNLQAQLAATNAALEDAESGAGAVASILDRLNERRQLITTMETELVGGRTTARLELDINTQVLAEIENAIREIIELNQHVNNQDYDNLVAEWNSLAETVQLSEQAIANFEAERAAAAERASVARALEELGYFFNMAKSAGLGYIEVLELATSINGELTQEQKALLLSTFELTAAQALIAEETANYEKSVELLALRLRLGLITESESLNEQLSLAENLLFLAAAANGEFSDEAEIAKARVEALKAAINNLNQAIDELTLRYELGLINRQEYLTQQISILQDELVKLAGEYGVTSEQVEEHKKRIKELENELDILIKTQNGYGDSLRRVASLTGGAAADFANFAAKVADAVKAFTIEGGGNLGDMISSIVGSFNQLLGPIEDSTGQLIQSFTGVAGSIIDIFLPGVGKAVAAIGSLIGALFSLGNSAKKARGEVEDAFKAVNYISPEIAKMLTSIEGTTKRVKMDGFLGWLGFKKTVKDEAVINELIGYFNQIAGVLSGSLSNAIKASMNGEDWEAAFEDSFRDSILNAIQQTFIEATLLASGFQEVMFEFTKIMKEQGSKAAFDFLAGQIPNIMDLAKDAIKDFVNFIPDAFKVTEDLWKSTEKNLNRIRKGILESSDIFDESLANTIIDLATITNAVNKTVLRFKFGDTKGLFGNIFNFKVIAETITEFEKRIDEAALNALVTLATSIAEGIQTGFRNGIQAFVRGDADWKEQLKESIKSSIVNALIDAFITSAAVNSIISGFVADFITALQSGDNDAAEFARKGIVDAVDGISKLIEGFVDALPPELLPSTNPRSPDYKAPPPGRRGTLTTLGEITGATRDLFLELLTPLSILPSWTSMIKDIRNDVRAIAMGSGIISPPSMDYTIGVPAMANVVNNTSIVMNNPVFNTMAKNGKELYDDISEEAYKNRKGRR